MCARPKKDGKSVTLLMERDLLERLQEYCERKYLSKTAAIEKALEEMLDREEENRW